MNLFESPDFRQFAQPIPSKVQKLFEHIRRGEYRSAHSDLTEIREALDQVSVFVTDEMGAE